MKGSGIMANAQGRALWSTQKGSGIQDSGYPTSLMGKDLTIADSLLAPTPESGHKELRMAEATKPTLKDPNMLANSQMEWKKAMEEWSMLTSPSM